MAQIHHLHWQAKVQPGLAPCWDEHVVGFDDLQQAIRIIILTPKLSVPTAPEQFCDALSYIDRTPDIAIPMITKEIWDAITKWEPRVELVEARVRAIAHYHFRANVLWRPVESVAQEIIQTDVDLVRQAA